MFKTEKCNRISVFGRNNCYRNSQKTAKCLWGTYNRVMSALYVVVARVKKDQAGRGKDDLKDRSRSGSPAEAVSERNGQKTDALIKADRRVGINTRNL